MKKPFFCSVTTLKGSRSEKRKEPMKVKVKVSQKRVLNFVYLSGDVLMTIEDVCKDVKWSSVIDMIANEEWYKSCKKWRFVFELKNLEPDDILESEEESIKIISIKIVPQISFELPLGEFLVSVPFDSCNSWRDGQVYVIGACFEAHKKLRELGKDGYGTDKTKIHPLIDTYLCCGHETPCHHGEEHPYVFRDKNDKVLNIYDILEDPGDDNLIIVAVPKQVYCYHLREIQFHGPLRDGQRRKIICEKVSLCPDCGFLHCPFCGVYQYNVVRTAECRSTFNM